MQTPQKVDILNSSWEVSNIKLMPIKQEKDQKKKSSAIEYVTSMNHKQVETSYSKQKHPKEHARRNLVPPSNNCVAKSIQWGYKSQAFAGVMSVTLGETLSLFLLYMTDEQICPMPKLVNKINPEIFLAWVNRLTESRLKTFLVKEDEQFPR